MGLNVIDNVGSYVGHWLVAGTFAPPPATQGLYYFVVNTACDAEFDALQLRPQMFELLQANLPPANDADK